MKDWYTVALEELKEIFSTEKRVSGLEFLEDFVLKYRSDFFEDLEYDEVDDYVSEEFDSFQAWLAGNNSEYVNVGKNGKWYSKSTEQKVQTDFKASFNLTTDEVKLLELEALGLHAGKVQEFKALYQKLSATNFHELKFKCAFRLATCAELNRDITENELIQFWINASEVAKQASLIKDACKCTSKAAYHYVRISNPEEAAKLYEHGFEIVKDIKFENKMQLLKNARIQFQLFGDHDSASRIFNEEKKLEVNEASKSKKIALWLYNVSSNYGESPSRVLFNCFIILLISTFISFEMNITVNTDENISNLSYLARSAYYSVVTFTTLGYGDFYPKTHPGQLFASILALLGLIYSSLFMVTVVRKYSRF